MGQPTPSHTCTGPCSKCKQWTDRHTEIALTDLKLTRKIGEVQTTDYNYYCSYNYYYLNVQLTLKTQLTLETRFLLEHPTLTPSLY